MPLIQYESKAFRPAALAVIAQANVIIQSYRRQGYDLTLRQLYYQFVRRNLIVNHEREYKRLGSIVSDARRAGLIDWYAIVDRTRNLHAVGSWESPAEIIQQTVGGYTEDWWEDQPYYAEVWFEKDAMLGVLGRAADDWRVPYFSCRGFASDSAVWSAGQRLVRKIDGGKNALVLYFGDHDPSGIDMTRDIEDRLHMFARQEVPIKRIALNMDQIEEYGPPPNPAKDTDTRFAGYRDKYGDESWELDALEPSVLATLVDSEIELILDHDAWKESQLKELEGRAQLYVIAEEFPRIVKSNAARIAKRFKVLKEDNSLTDDDE